MKNAAVLSLAIGLLAVVVAPGAAQGFQEVPPTWGLAGSTAYTLRARELQLGVVSVTDPMSLYVNYGITSDLQVGLWPIYALRGSFNVGGKFRFGLSPDLEMALPVHYWYWTGSGSQELHVGIVLGLQVGTALWLDAGLTVVTGQHCYWWGCRSVLFSTPHVIAQFALAETARVVVEVEPMNLKVKAGILVRVLDSIDLRATVSLVPSVSAWLGVELRLLLVRPKAGPGGR